MKKLIYEKPVSDYLPDEFKKSAKDASKRLYDDPANPAPSSNQVGMLMMTLPRFLCFNVVSTNHKLSLNRKFLSCKA